MHVDAVAADGTFGFCCGAGYVRREGDHAITAVGTTRAEVFEACCEAAMVPMATLARFGASVALAEVFAGTLYADCTREAGLAGLR